MFLSRLYYNIITTFLLGIHAFSNNINLFFFYCTVAGGNFVTFNLILLLRKHCRINQYANRKNMSFRGILCKELI